MYPMDAQCMFSVKSSTSRRSDWDIVKLLS